MIGRDFPVTARGVDSGFVSRQRAKGLPEAHIARMGGWCLADVQAVPTTPESRPFPRPARTPKALPPPLIAMEIPEVAAIIRHIAEQYCVEPEDILGHSHQQEFVEPRHEAFAVCWELNRFTLHQMAQIFNKTGPGITYGLETHYRRLRTRGPGRDW